jgi:uncharacterized protein YkwD
VPAIVTAAVLGLGAWGGLALRNSATMAAAPAEADRGVASPTPTLEATDGAASPTASPTATQTPTPAPTTPPPPTSEPPATTTPPPQPPAPPPPGSENEAYELQVVDLVNAERAAAGCAPMTVDSHLVAAARAHSADMAARDYFDHTTPEGVTFSQRIEQAGFAWSLAAENIAYGYRDPESVMRGWMNSDGHRKNILNCRLTHIGVGLAYGPNNRPYWTQDFATPR